MKNFARLVTLTAMIFFGLMTSANAAVESYEGIGVYYMENESELVDDAKERAKMFAEIDILEQISLKVGSYSTARQSDLTRDEIETIVAGIMNVTDTKYDMNYENNIMVITATVNAEVDIDKVNELLEREIKRRAYK